MSHGQPDRRIAALPVAHQILQRVGESQRIQRQRHQPRNQAVHRIVEARRLVRNQSRGIAGLRFALAALRRNRHRETADRGDRLAEFIVQFMRNQTALFLDALLDEQRHLAPLIQSRFGLLRLAFGLHLVLHGFRHAIEGGARFRALRSPCSGGRRNARSPCCTCRNPPAMTGNGASARSTDQNASPLTTTSMTAATVKQPLEVVPGIEYGARRVGLYDQLSAPGSRNRIGQPESGDMSRTNQAGASRPAL